MTHKIAYLKSSRHIYTQTNVAVDRTIRQIQKMLEQAGCSRIATQTDYRGEIPLHTLAFEKENIPFIIEFPIIYEKLRSTDKLRMDISGRIIHDRIKALLIEVEIGVSPFSAAMMQFRALPDPKTGKPVQMENYVLENPDRVALGRLGEFTLQLPEKV